MLARNFWIFINFLNISPWGKKNRDSEDLGWTRKKVYIKKKKRLWNLEEEEKNSKTSFGTMSRNTGRDSSIWKVGERAGFQHRWDNSSWWKGEIEIDRFTMFRCDTWLSPSNFSGRRDGYNYTGISYPIPGGKKCDPRSL